jgi:serine/threonine protein kinase
MVGTTVAHYRILQKLGEGGMGVVYKAEDLKLTRTVALKFLPHGLGAHEGERARFLQEARAAAILNHPNICTVYDIQEHEGQQFIVLEYVEGVTLREKIAGGSLPKETAVSYAIQIAEALEEAHGKGIVHRDIKAENIMVTRDRVKVMDFGLAKLKGSLKLTKTSSTLGTLAYMAPEQIEGREVDARSDIFSFGVVLYEMLCGQTPFRGEHEAAMMYSILNEEPPPLQTVLPGAPSELLHTVNRALEKDPEERYQTVREMLIDLRRLKKDSSRVSRQHIPVGPAPLAPAPPASPGKSGSQRKRLWLAGAGIVVLCAIFAFLLVPRGVTVRLNPNRSFRAIAVSFKGVGYGSLSKDGNWFVFPARDDSGRWDVYWTSLAGGEPSRITHENNSMVISAEVSPEADLVLYTRFTDPELQLSEVRIVPLQGGLSRCIADTGIGGIWRPDGKRIGFIRTGRQGTYSRAPSASGHLEIWSMKPDGTECRLELMDSLSRRVAPYSFCWSPDGRSIAWVRNAAEERGEVMIHEFDTGNERQLTFDRETVDEVIWASNETILFISTRSGSSNLWAIPSGGGEAVQVTQGTAPIITARISADTKKLVYMQRDQISHIWITGLDGGNARQVTYDERAYTEAAFSPDGRQIACVIGGVDQFNPECQLWVMDREGKNRRALTSGSQIVEYCRWSPDGKWLAYLSRPVGEHPDSAQVYLIDPARPGAPRLLGPGSQCEWLDGENLVALRWPTNWQYSTKGGPGTRVYPDSTWGIPILQTHQRLYRDLRAGREGRWIVALDSSGRETGEPRRVRLLENVYTSGPPGSRFRVYRKPGGSELWRMWLPEGKEERIGSALPGMTYIFGVSADGKNILWLEFSGRAKLGLIENLFE